MKHFVCITKSINNKSKGSYEYLKYLWNKEDHPKDEIINFEKIDRKSYLNSMKKIEDKFIKFKKEKKMNNKRINYSQSFCLSLPPQQDPLDINKFELIKEDLLKTIQEIYNLSDNEFNEEFIKNNIFINTHYRVNNNTHFNVVLNKLFENKIVDLSKKRYIYKLKDSFTKSVKKHLNIIPPMNETELINKELMNEINELKEINIEQNKKIEKVLNDNDLMKWSLIFIQNAEKYINNIEKMEENLKKRENNILKFEDDYLSIIINDSIKKFDIYQLNEEIQEKYVKKIRSKSLLENNPEADKLVEEMKKEIVIHEGKKGYWEEEKQNDKFGNFECYIKVFKPLKRGF